MLLAWNAVGIAGKSNRIHLKWNDNSNALLVFSSAYQYFGNTEKSDEDDLSPSARFAIKLGIDKAKIVKVEGISRSTETDFKLEDYVKKDAETKSTVKPIEAVLPRETDEFEWNTQENVQLE